MKTKLQDTTSNNFYRILADNYFKPSKQASTNLSEKYFQPSAGIIKPTIGNTTHLQRHKVVNNISKKRTLNEITQIPKSKGY